MGYVATVRDSDGVVVECVGPFPCEEAADFWAAENEEELASFDVRYEPFRDGMNPVPPGPARR